MAERDKDTANVPVGKGREWGVRLGSAVVLAAVSFVALWFSPVTFAVLVLLLAGAASWEWSDLVAGNGSDPVAATATIAIALAIAMLVGFAGTPAAVSKAPLPFDISYAVFAPLLVVVVAAMNTTLRSWRQHRWWRGFGVLYIGLPCLALVGLRLEQPNGYLAVLFVIVVVAVTDTGAFVFGRLIGGPKLWPRVSPKKTWAGFLGGAAAALAAAYGFAAAIGHAMPIRMLGIAAVLSVVSVAGDLFELAAKRRFGRKDMSALIPGHGGVLDRVDGLIFAALAAMLFALIADRGALAEAVLGWPALVAVP